MVSEDNQLEWVRGPIRVTVLYFGLYYVLLFSQSFTKLYLFSQLKHNKKSDENVSLTKTKYFRCGLATIS